MDGRHSWSVHSNKALLVAASLVLPARRHDFPLAWRRNLAAVLPWQAAQPETRRACGEVAFRLHSLVTRSLALTVPVLAKPQARQGPWSCAGGRGVPSCVR